MAFFWLSSLIAKAVGSVHRDDIQVLLKTSPVLVIGFSVNESFREARKGGR